jgi:membrane-associated protease RseP (regulator of RpoE activity)
VYHLPDGTPFQAGVSLIPTGGADFWAISFHEPFACAPTVIARVVSDGDSWKLEKHPAQPESFTVRVDGPESAQAVPIHWMAFEAPDDPRARSIENGASLPRIGQVELREWRVDIEKEPGAPLGLMYVAEKWSLRVTGVSGFLEEWAAKAARPDDGLLIGDRIVEVNDVREDGERLRAEILAAKAASAVAFSVQREETAYVNVPAGILGIES